MNPSHEFDVKIKVQLAKVWKKLKFFWLGQLEWVLKTVVLRHCDVFCVMFKLVSLLCPLFTHFSRYFQVFFFEIVFQIHGFSLKNTSSFTSWSQPFITFENCKTLSIFSPSLNVFLRFFDVTREEKVFYFTFYRFIFSSKSILNFCYFFCSLEAWFNFDSYF